MDAKAHKALEFLLWHLAAGIGGALVLGGLVLWFDIGRLRTLIWSTGEPVLALGLFLFGLFVTFGGCAFAAGLMAQGRRDRR